VDSDHDVIDAFIDGERVDTGALRRALADPAGLDYFIDAWMLREAVQQDPDAIAADPRAVVAPPRRTAGKWMVAAALVAGLAGGYAAGSRVLGSTSAPVTAPPVTTVLARPDAREVFPAPRPTRVIQLEFHPDSNGGGN
jgi:hypothetical protein